MPADSYAMLFGLALTLWSIGAILFPFATRYVDEELGLKIFLGIGLAIMTGASVTLLHRSQSLMAQVKNLEAANNVTASFLDPEIKPREGGGYNVRIKMHINTSTPRTGLTVGFTAPGLSDDFEIGSTDKSDVYPYSGFEDLGARRLHIRRVSGQYTFNLQMSDGDLTIGYRFEGKQQSASVTWKVP